MSFESDEYLEHFGVKGMKWGVRKKRVSVSADRAEASRLSKRDVKSMSNKELETLGRRQKLETTVKNVSPSKTSTKYVKPKKVAQLSDRELKAKLERIRMETEYAKLTKEQRDKHAAGKAFVADIFKSVVSDFLSTQANNAASSAYSNFSNRNGSNGSNGSSVTVTQILPMANKIRRAITSG